MMSNLKSPFDYMDNEDLAKIEEWLALPNPTIADASRILGVDAGYMAELTNLEYDPDLSEQVIAPTKLPIVRHLKRLQTVFRSALAYLKATVFGVSDTDKVAIVISKTSSMPLNILYDSLIEAQILDRTEIESIEIFRERSALTAFGDPPISEIRIQLNEKDYDAQSHYELMKVLAGLVEIDGSGSLNDQEVLAHFQEKYSE